MLPVPKIIQSCVCTSADVGKQRFKSSWLTYSSHTNAVFIMNQCVCWMGSSTGDKSLIKTPALACSSSLVICSSIFPSVLLLSKFNLARLPLNISSEDHKSCWWLQPPPSRRCSHRYETRALRWSSGEAEPRHVSVMLHVSSFVMAYYPTGKVSEAERHASLILLTCSDWVCLIIFCGFCASLGTQLNCFLCLHLENKSESAGFISETGRPLSATRVWLDILCADWCGSHQ